jgi:biopolymer transport protein ExbD
MAIAKLPDEDIGEEETIFSEINITPLTDVFLVMVIIFMVSALAVQVEERNKEKQHQKQAEQLDQEQKSGLRITLPQGKQQDIDRSKPSLVLEVPINGDIAVAGKIVTDAQIDTLFGNAFARDKDTQVLIRADRAVVHGRVVNLMERARAKGLSHIGIVTGSK